jgi:glycosyltransferase involved in cell wall biosynthesis
MKECRGRVKIPNEKNPSGVCIVSFPIGKAFTTPVSNLSAIISELYPTQVVIGSYDQIHLADKKSLTVHLISHKAGTSKILQVIRFSVLNIKIILQLFSFRQMGGKTIFFTELCPVIPMVFSKLSGKKVYWLLPSGISLVSIGLSSRFENFLSRAGYMISDRILVYSPHLVTQWQLEPYRQKILIARHHFIDINAFSIIIPFSNRPVRIGFIGRFSEEKGIRNFITALPEIFSCRKDLHVFIGGDGPLKEPVVESLKNQGLTSRVDIIDWISHDDLPLYLNNLRLLVIPSYTEGLPNIMLEAMACGTPVLATKIGAVPDIITEGVTGFFMEDNTPKCIAKNVIRALHDPNLEKIAQQAKTMIEREFTFDNTMKQWKRILDQP